MKGNKDKVIQYLSGMMTDDEKVNFELELESSAELHDLHQKYLKNLSSIKKLSETPFDERYFASLIPKVRAKISETKRPALVYRLASVLPALALTVFILINILYIDTNTSSSFEELVQEVIANSDSGAIAEIADGYSSYFFEDYAMSLDLDDDYFDETEITANELADKFNSTIIDNYTLYDNLSEEDIDNIYNSLINKKIL